MDTEPLAPLRGRRPLLAFAPEPGDPRLRALADAVERDRAGVQDRKVVLVTAHPQGGSTTAGDAPTLSSVGVDALRRDYGVGAADFLVVLVGEDGAEWERWNRPPSLDEVFARVDRAPTRDATGSAG